MALLCTLRIRDLVIIEDLTVEFGPGLNLLTGETGAGKSILIDALGLVAGDRADRSLVRSGSPRASVEALFDIENDGDLRRWAGERGIGEIEEDQLLVRREIAAAGAGRILVNGSPCTLGLLRELVERLIDLHRQHEQRSLVSADRHLELLDRFGGHGRELARVAEAHAAVAQARAARLELERQAEARATRVESLERTVREIEALEPRAGELEELAAERRVLQNAERVRELLDQVVTLTYEGEPAAAGLAAGAASRAEELSRLDPALEELAGRLRSAAVELQDAGAGIRDYRNRADFDPARLHKLEERRVALERLCLAHGVDEAGLLALRDRAGEELTTLGKLDEALAEATATLRDAEAGYVTAAAALSRKRRRAASKMDATIGAQLGPLALEKARFATTLEAIDGEDVDGTGLSVRGAERAEFHLAANPGEPARPLGQVASGGELSRVMLALHVLQDDGATGRVLVFDEIDSGVGGAVADAVGARLDRLARRAQVLCVTHLPQIAAYADWHFSVSKEVSRGRTRAVIANLSDRDRVEELARMLGGRKATTASRKHASELLSAAARPRSRT